MENTHKKQEEKTQQLFAPSNKDFNAISISINREAFATKLLQIKPSNGIPLDLRTHLLDFQECVYLAIDRIPEQNNLKSIFLAPTESSKRFGDDCFIFLTTMSKEEGTDFLCEFLSTSCDTYLDSIRTIEKYGPVIYSSKEIAWLFIQQLDSQFTRRDIISQSGVANNSCDLSSYHHKM